VREFGQAARLERVRAVASASAGAPEAWRKTHRHAASAAREVAAYQALAALQGVWLPRLLGFDADRDALTLSHVEGRSGAEPGWSVDAVCEQMRALGRLRAALDGVAVHEDDPLTLDAAIARRRDAWLARGVGLLPRRTSDALRTLIDPDAFTGQPRRWCHRDLRPDNWIVTDEPGAAGRAGDGVIVLDLGQARPDAAEVDVAKLITDVWWPRPDAARALAKGFFAGWGASMACGARQQRVFVATALHALCTRVWAGHHGDAATAVRAGRWLDSLIARPETLTELLETTT
jgi:aminoglycoside/choline kinase family phosphotransferase